jgi:hypothetical protein
MENKTNNEKKKGENMMKHIICDNIITEEDLKSAREYLTDECEIIKPSDSEVLERAKGDKEDWYYTCISDCDVPTDHPIVIFCDNGEFGGHKKGYLILDNVLHQIFLRMQETRSQWELYADDADAHCDETTENGTNHYLYREFVGHINGVEDEDEALEEFEDELWTAIEENDEATLSELILNYTKSIRPYMENIYEWTE